MKKYIEIDRMLFEIMKPIETERRSARHALKACYDRSSERKQGIF